MMRAAIFTATAQGMPVARRVQAALDGETEIFSKQGTVPAGQARCYVRLADAVDGAFPQYDALIFVMAAGIAVRMIAPHIRSKLEDPAVVVMDERGENVISLLSGHIGGANELARCIASAIGGNAIITTATDVEGKLAPDVIAAHLGLRPWPKEEIKTLNQGMLNGRSIRWFVDDSLPNWEFYQNKLVDYGLLSECLDLEQMPPLPGLMACITAKELPERKGVLYLAPRRLIAGIGCRRGVSEELIWSALIQATSSIGRHPEDISLFASTAVKKNEKGLLGIAKSYGREIRFFTTQELSEVVERYGLAESFFVRETIGIGNVAEAAALCCVKSGRIALPKTKYEKVTVALVWEK